MKRILQLLVLVMLTSSSIFAQLSSYDVVLQGEITTNTTLSASNRYLLRGFVYVTDGATLTIPAGTIIFGEKSTKGALIIERGGKIDAQGTATNPIIFTSQQPAGSRGPGDWGGIIICGKAPNNTGLNVTIEGGVRSQYGGTDAADNSGTMRYVRIEFPGITFSPNNEINGLTLGSVGSGTTIENIQVSFSGDDAFEWFGGTVNCRNLVAFKSIDDDFDTDFGFSGSIQFGIAYRDPAIADQSKSEAFESDNQGSESLAEPRTSAVFSNITCIGPRYTTTTVINPNHFWGAQIRRGSMQSIINSVFLGFNTGGILFDGPGTQAAATGGTLKFKNNYVALEGAAAASGNANGAFDHATYFTANNNTSTPNNADALLTNPYNILNPNLVPAAGSPLLSGADFTGFTQFTSTSYRGAFGNDGNRWDAGWTNYDPQSRNWNSSVAWTSTLRYTNQASETRYITLGRATGASDGLDASLGEINTPSAFQDDIDARFILTAGNESFLDLRADDNNSKTYEIFVQPGTATGTNTVTLAWDPNLLGPGTFTLRDGLNGLVFANVNMKSVASQALTGLARVFIDHVPTATNSFTLQNGWNMVSFPGWHTSGTYTPAHYINGNFGTYVASSLYSFSAAGSYVSESTVEPGKPYWVKVTNGKAANQTYKSSVRKNYSGRTSGGWSLIGALEYTYDASRLTTIPSNLISGSVFGYTSGVGYQTVTSCEPGKAYWVFTTGTGEVVIPGPYTGLAKSVTSPNLVKSEWGKIIITDKNGSTATLYSVNGKVNLNNYNLPPVPPVGAFDVRFGSDRYAENLSSGQNIQLNSLEYPVKITPVGMTLKVRDAVNGDFINTTIADGGEFVISNSAFNVITVATGSFSPNEYTLEQNYPNPFNPATTITFAIPENAQVTLNVYDALGQKVAELVNSVLTAGSYNVEWNASQVASGLYFYELKSNQFSSIKKMLLVK